MECSKVNALTDCGMTRTHIATKKADDKGRLLKVNKDIMRGVG